MNSNPPSKALDQPRQALLSQLLQLIPLGARAAMMPRLTPLFLTKPLEKLSNAVEKTEYLLTIYPALDPPSETG